jgi:hypothetical protein
MREVNVSTVAGSGNRAHVHLTSATAPAVISGGRRPGPI